MLLLMVSPICAAKILFLPINMDSHVLLFSHLAVDLAHLGHVTRVVAPSNARVPHFVEAEVDSGGNFSYTTYPAAADESYCNSRQFSAGVMRAALSQSSWEKFTVTTSVIQEMFDHLESDCVSLLNHGDLMQDIRNGGYQFAVMDPFIPQCYYAIPYSMGIPYATLSLPVVTGIYRVPRLPSFAPLFGFAYTDRKNFFQRLTTFLVEYLLLLQFENKTTTYVERLAPDRPLLNANQLIQRVRS